MATPLRCKGKLYRVIRNHLVSLLTDVMLLWCCGAGRQLTTEEIWTPDPRVLGVSWLWVLRTVRSEDTGAHRALASPRSSAFLSVTKMLTRATVWLLFGEELSLSGVRYYHFECLNHHTWMVRARSNAFKRRVNESRVYTSRLKSINMIPVGLLRHSKWSHEWSQLDSGLEWYLDT